MTGEHHAFASPSNFKILSLGEQAPLISAYIYLIIAGKNIPVWVYFFVAGWSVTVQEQGSRKESGKRTLDETGQRPLRPTPPTDIQRRYLSGVFHASMEKSV